jgi:ABC-type phosphate transport system substrate-binding protein
MRLIRHSLIILVAAATAAVLITNSALADPPPPLTPKVTDIIGVGAETTQALFNQLSKDYRRHHITGPVAATVRSGRKRSFTFDVTGGEPPYTWKTDGEPGAVKITPSEDTSEAELDGTWPTVTVPDRITILIWVRDKKGSLIGTWVFVVIVDPPTAGRFAADTGSPLDNSLPSPELYSWDATNPVTGGQGDTIVTKANCAGIARPNGSGQGLAALEANAQPSGDTTNYCVDFARVSRARAATDPACTTGGICFVSLAGDAVSWADRSAAAGGTDAPKSLTLAQLTNIYECKDTNWKQVGGTSAPIEAYLPNTSSGTRTFFLTALGGGTTAITPGACVIDGTTSDPNSLEENEGVDPIFNTPEGIYIYSVGNYIGQAYHSAACSNNPNCGFPNAATCTPAKDQNAFGCNVTGVLSVGEIDDRSPLTTATVPTINPNFDAVFQRTLYDVVRYDPNTTDHIPGPESGMPGGIPLEQIFAANTAAIPGWTCGNSTAQTDIKDYGFLPTWKLSTCGAAN